jgi:FkbM family methyltransferase
MLTKKDLKVAARSGSLKFARHARPEARGEAEDVFHWRGIPVHYRPGTSDTTVIYEALIKSGRKGEYNVPANLAPQVILDIGGNIGVASIYFSQLFPGAHIHTFEPVPANQALLRRNVATLKNVTVHPVALGKADGKVDIFWSEEDANLGGFSLYRNNANTGKSLTIDVREAASYLAAQGIARADMIKIDTEGAEHDILTSIDDSMLAQVRWIVGELHGIADFEVLLHLSKHFDIDVKRSLGKKYFNFNACNKSFVETALKSGWRQRR